MLLRGKEGAFELEVRYDERGARRCRDEMPVVWD